MSHQKPKFVDLAALSLSGSLVPSVPTKLMLKYNPPTLTVTYYFEQHPKEEYYHLIPIDRHLLAAKSAEDFVSHLYVTEAYYFNPKQVKRPQLVRLIRRLQQNVVGDQENQQINIQDNSYQANVQAGNDNKVRKKNFFERKRFINYQEPGKESDSDDDPAKPNAQGKDAMKSLKARW